MLKLQPEAVDQLLSKAMAYLTEMKVGIGSGKVGKKFVFS